MDTQDRLKELYPSVERPIIRLDLDWPNVPKSMLEAPTDEKVGRWLMERAKAKGCSEPVAGVRYRNSSSGNLHVEIAYSDSMSGARMIELRHLLGDDDFRILCDSRRAVHNPVYLGGYVHDGKWIPGDLPNGKRGSVLARVTKWKEIDFFRTDGDTFTAGANRTTPSRGRTGK